MAKRNNTLLIKRSNVSGNKPDSGQVLLGELALNTADVMLYTSGTTTNSILPIGWDRISRTGDTMSGSLVTTGLGVGTDIIYSGSVNIGDSGSLRIGNSLFLSKSSNDLSIFEGKLVVADNGNVGIGKSEPTAKLDIVGEIKSTIDRWTIDMSDYKMAKIYADDNFKISSFDNILGTPIITIKVNDVAYNLGDSITMGSKIDITSDEFSVIKLKIEKNG